MEILGLRITRGRPRIVKKLNDVVESYYREYGKNPKAIWMSIESRQAYVEYLFHERRYVNIMEYDNGLRAMEFSTSTGDGGLVGLFVGRGLPDRALIATSSTSNLELLAKVH